LDGVANNDSPTTSTTFKGCHVLQADSLFSYAGELSYAKLNSPEESSHIMSSGERSYEDKCKANKTLADRIKKDCATAGEMAWACVKDLCLLGEDKDLLQSYTSAHKKLPSPSPGKATSVPCIPPPITYPPTRAPTANPWRLIGRNAWASDAINSRNKPLRLMQRDSSMDYCKASCLDLGECTGFTHDNHNNYCYMYIPRPLARPGWGLELGVMNLTSSELKRGYHQRSSLRLISFAKKKLKDHRTKQKKATTSAPVTGKKKWREAWYM
jgi:hypothetical protein